MNVVGGGIAVDDLDSLIGDNAEDGGCYLQPLCSRVMLPLGNVESARTEGVFDNDEKRLASAAAGHHVFIGGRFVPLAGGILAHVNVTAWARRLEFDDANDRAAGGGSSVVAVAPPRLLSVLSFLPHPAENNALMPSIAGSPEL